MKKKETSRLKKSIKVSEMRNNNLIAELKADPSLIRTKSEKSIEALINRFGWWSEYQENKKEDGEHGEKPWQFLRRKLGLDK